MKETNPKEYEVQDIVRKALEEKAEIYPYEILYIDQQESSLALLKISVWIREDIEELKKLLNYSSLCDKTGYLEFSETNTVILRGYALLSFFRSLGLYN
mgnify:CR=1 FL=1